MLCCQLGDTDSGGIYRACLSMGFVLLISNRIGNMSSLIIGGVMIGYICTAVTDFVVTLQMMPIL